MRVQWGSKYWLHGLGIHLNQEQTIVQYSNVSTIPNLNFLGYSGDLKSELVGIRIVENSLFVKWFLIQTTIWIPNNHLISDHLNNEPVKKRTSKSLLFKCFHNSNVRYSDPHCIQISNAQVWIIWIQTTLVFGFPLWHFSVCIYIFHMFLFWSHTFSLQIIDQ